MTYAKKVVLHLQSTNRPGLENLIERFIQDEVRYVGVVGPDCAFVEDFVDEICVGPCDGSRPAYAMLTVSHKDESLQDAMDFATTISGDIDGHSIEGEVQIVTLG